MITKTYSYIRFSHLDNTSNAEKERIEKTYVKFFETSEDIDLVAYLTEFKNAINTDVLFKNAIKSLALFHTVFYEGQCNTEFSPEVVTLINDLNATFCITAQEEGEQIIEYNTIERDLYSTLDRMRMRPAMFIGQAMISRMSAFIDGYRNAFNYETIEQPPFQDFMDFVGMYYHKATFAGWEGLIRYDFEDEYDALRVFYILLDLYRGNACNLEPREMVLKLMNAAFNFIKAENDVAQKQQIADLHEKISDKLDRAIHLDNVNWYKEILEDIFLLARNNPFLHAFIRKNAPETLHYEYELYHGMDGESVVTTCLKRAHAQKNYIVGKGEKLINTFFAFTPETANYYKENWMWETQLKHEKEKIMESHKLSFFTEYYQFYILDAETKSATDDAHFWNDEAGKRKLAVVDGLMGVTVAKYAEIKVEVRVLNAEPMLDGGADFITEASLKLESGILQVKCCTNFDTQLELKLEKGGAYRVRVSSFNLSTVQNDEGNDYYVVDIWKKRFAKPKVLKK